MPPLNRLHRGFTAIELLVSIAIGIVILGVMFAIFRAVANTAGRVARLSQENQALRSGILAVCEQHVDLWTDVDDPVGDPGDPRPDYLQNTIRNSWNANVWNQTDPAKPIDGGRGQGLRGFDSTQASTPENWCTGSKQGLPFTPFEWMRDLTEFGDPALAIFAPSPAALAGSEDETGWDRDQHWAAADERTWFHGDAGVTVPKGPAASPNPGSSQTARRLQFGRYAIISSPYRNVNLTAGYTDTDFGTTPVRHSWRERMLLGMVNTLGYYGAAEYLPANTIWATTGARFLDPSGTRTLRPDNRTIGPLPAMSQEAPTPCWGFIGTISGGSGTTFYGFPGWKGSPSEMYWGGQVLSLGVFPASVYARDPFYPSTSPYSYLGGKAKNQSQVSTPGLVGVHRDNDGRQNHAGPFYHGPRGNYEGADYMLVNMATVKRPLLVQRPKDWPEVNIGTSRVLWGGQFTNTCLVRWVDQTTGRFQSISFNVCGTTLRGARQQRRLPAGYADPGGWARWLEPWAMRRERKASGVSDPWSLIPNDRCLDDYADPAGADPRFRP